MLAISLNNFTDRFSAPVLLIHAANDQQVPVSLSLQMNKLLKKHKAVKLVELKGEDHHLQEGATRLQALTEMVSFINQHIGTKKLGANAN